MDDKYGLLKILRAVGMYQSYSVPLGLRSLDNTRVATTTKVLVLSCDWKYDQSFGGDAEILKEVRIRFDGD